MRPTAEIWNELVQRLREVDLLSGTRGVLAWDQQTYMPPAAAGSRAEQAALLVRLHHERFTDPQIGAWLEELAERDDLDPVQQAGVRNLGRSWRREALLPSSLVERLGKLQASGFGAWMQARRDEDFGALAPVLREIFDAMRERASLVDPSRPAYDVLLEDHDRGIPSSWLAPTFERLREGLQELLDAVRDAEPPARISGTFDTDRQLAMHRELVAALGYDLSAGRLDEAEHPFTVPLGRGDVRITTHVYADDLLAGLGGTIHETGHGLYEQGLPRERIGTGTDGPASTGVHESQSRLWENFLGRSLPFFRWLAGGPMERHFPGHGLSADALYAAANRLAPGPIRIYADEVSYNLHIIVRFELEKAVLDGELEVDDLPDAWNERYERILGLRPRTLTEGVLQDVHWCTAAIGYFPSYTLGNLYAASFGATLEEELPELWPQVEAGEFGAVLGWLRERVHAHGRVHEPQELVRRVVGERDHVEDLLVHVWGRHGALYGVSRPS